ncbi:MAG: CDP-alcohol phosphatidyltransferase family protein [Patescibacteria group bacterium]
MPKFKQKVLQLAEMRMKDLARVTPIDKVIKFLFLGLIPKSVTPNQITVFRFVSVPFILALLLTEQNLWAFVLFLFSALSDAVDGALARTEGQITRWGILADPLADKLLVGSVAVVLISKYLSWHLTFVIVALEIFILASAYFRYRGKALPAKITGKIKMVLQCFGIIFLFCFVLFGGAFWLLLAQGTLYLGVLFALLSLFVHRSI